VLILDPAGPRVKRVVAPGPLGTGYAHYVNNGMLRYTADGRVLVYGMSPPLWACDPETGSASVLGKRRTIDYDVSPSPDGQVWAISEVGEKGVLFVSPTTGSPVADPLEHPDWVFSARFDRAGDHLLTACRDGVARLWDRQAGRVLAAYRHGDEVFGAEFVPGERFVVTVSADRTARVWAGAGGQPVCRPVGLGGRGLSLDLTPDGRYAVAAGFGGRVTVLDLRGLTAPADGSSDELTLRAELSSGQRIADNGGVAFLTAGEWFGRWTEYRRRTPPPGPKP
jgi:WD40 repeat protein